jgi:hypothetical protein
LGNKVLHLRTWRTKKERKKQRAGPAVKPARRRRPAAAVPLDLPLPSPDAGQASSSASLNLAVLGIGATRSISIASVGLTRRDRLLLRECPKGAKLARVHLRSDAPFPHDWLLSWWPDQGLDARQLLAAQLLDACTISILIDARIVEHCRELVKAKKKRKGKSRRGAIAPSIQQVRQGESRDRGWRGR